jgi:hypothetical protein
METTLKNKIMKNTTENETFILSQDDKEIFRGTENECYVKLQRTQSNSADWTMKYEGWKIEPLTPKN